MDFFFQEWILVFISHFVHLRMWPRFPLPLLLTLELLFCPILCKFVSLSHGNVSLNLPETQSLFPPSPSCASARNFYVFAFSLFYISWYLLRSWCVSVLEMSILLFLYYSQGILLPLLCLRIGWLSWSFMIIFSLL